MKTEKAIALTEKLCPNGKFRYELSRNNWQLEVVEAVKSLGQQLQQFTFVTHSQGDSLFVRVAASAELEEINRQLPVRRDEQEEDGCEEENHSDDDETSGCIEIRYWQRYKDLLKEQKRETGKVPKIMKETWESLFGPKGRTAFQHDWPILEICHDTSEGGRISCGPFLNRVTKKGLRRMITKAILEEMCSWGLIARRGRYGPFLTLDGEKIHITAVRRDQQR